MFIYLVAIVVIICSIFGLTYTQTSAIGSEGARLSTIQLPAFMHSTPLIEHPQAGVNGDNGIAGSSPSSQQSLEISSEGMEEANSAEKSDDDRLIEQDRYQLERQIFNQKLKDANQIGLAESLWSTTLQKHASKDVKDNMDRTHESDGSKQPPQKLNTNTIFNMIQYETFKEAMAVLQNQQEQEEATKLAQTQLEKSTKNTELIFPNEENKENLPVPRNPN